MGRAGSRTGSMNNGWGRPRTAGDIAATLAPALAQLCGGLVTPREGWSAERQACEDAERLQNALTEVGEHSRVSHRADEAWEPLEGTALLAHPDPLGALQRGEVPAIVLRRVRSIMGGSMSSTHVPAYSRHSTLALTYAFSVCTARGAAAHASADGRIRATPLRLWQGP